MPPASLHSSPYSPLHTARCPLRVCAFAPRCLSGGAKGRRGVRLVPSPRRALSVAAARLAAVALPALRRTPQAPRSRLDPN